MYEEISSLANPRVRRVLQLQQKARTRKKENCFIIEGIRLFLDTPDDFLEEIYITADLLERGEPRVRDKITRHGCRIVTPEIMKKMSDTMTPQGVLCLASMPRYSMDDLLTGCPLLLLLENIQDPGNLGTMFRTAEAAGVTGILMNKETADLFNPKTVRSTMSAVFRMPFLVTEDFSAGLEQLRGRGLRIFAAHLAGQDNYDRADYTGPCGILIGNEGRGLTEEAAALATDLIRIPMHGRIESLNAAMAAGILMYEADRQRRQADR